MLCLERTVPEGNSYPGIPSLLILQERTRAYPTNLYVTTRPRQSETLVLERVQLDLDVDLNIFLSLPCRHTGQ